MPARLSALEAREISLVDRPANRRRFLLVKRDGAEERLDEVKALQAIEKLDKDGLGGALEALAGADPAEATALLAKNSTLSDDDKAKVRAALRVLGADLAAELPALMRKAGMAEQVRKPFGEHKDFAACVAANGGKADPEGYCAALHQQMTGKYPTEKAAFTLSRAVVQALCPECAAEMVKRNLAALKVTDIEALPAKFVKAVLAKVSDPGFFTKCASDLAPVSGATDPTAFCAWMHERLTGMYPSESAAALRKRQGGSTVADETKAPVQKRADGTWDLTALPEEQRPAIEAVLKSASETETALREELKKADDARKATEADLAAIRSASERAAAIQKAQDFKDLPNANPDDLGPILLKVQKALETAEYDRLCSILKASAVIVRKSAAFLELGAGGGGEQGARAELLRKAEDERKVKPTLTIEQAKAAVLKRDRDLFNRVSAEDAERLTRSQQ